MLIEMDERAVLSTLKYVSAIEKEFLLSTILDYLEGNPHLDELYSMIHPRLTDLDLFAERVENDYLVKRKEPAGFLVPDQADIEKIRLFFAHPEIPASIQALFERYIENKTGKRWNDPAVIGRIRNAVLQQKAQYWRGSGGIGYRKGYSVMGYLAYQAPVYIIQFEHLLYNLAADGLVKSHVRMLDVGTGPGVVPLAVIDLYSRLHGFSADIFAVERSDEFLQAYREIVVPLAGEQPGITIHDPLQMELLDPEAGKLPASLDLIVIQNALNEMEKAKKGYGAEILLILSTLLSSDGSIIVAEPADMENSTGLRRIVYQALKKGLSIYSPCPSFWGLSCRAESCWSFIEKPPLAPTRLMNEVARGPDSYRFINTDIKYSFAILRKDGRAREEFKFPKESRYARLSALQRHINRKIDVVAAVISGELGDENTHVFRICDGTAQRPVFAILPSYHTTPQNRQLLSVRYGSPAEFRQVLVRFNKEHNAYNLLVTRHSTVNLLK
jgi:hypothetical protein